MSKLHSQRPRTFWWISFFKKLFSQFSMDIQRSCFQLCRNVSTKSSKMSFTCPDEHYDKNILLTLWNNCGLWARKYWICGGKFAALLSNLHFCLQMGNWKNGLEWIFTFFDILWTSREHFLVFSLYHSRHGGPNWISLAKRNISSEKTFYPFRTMSAFFWTFIEVF